MHPTGIATITPPQLATTLPTKALDAAATDPEGQQIDQLSPLKPHRPRGDNGGWRPVLSKKKSASDVVTTSRDMLPQRSGSFRNLKHFDRAKATASHPPVMSQGSSHSSRDSGGRAAASERKTSDEDGAPYSPQEVLDRYSADLTLYEKTEVTKFSKVYYYSTVAIKSQRGASNDLDQNAASTDSGTTKNESVTTKPVLSKPVILFNDGYDDERGDYVMVIQDHLAYRYEVLHALGSGSFGQVVCCLDHVTKNKVAVKVIRNRRKYTEQAMVEIRMLTQLQVPVKRRQSITADPLTTPTGDGVDTHHTVQMIEHFYFRNHLCITFELLGMNLYDYLKLRFFQGMPMTNLRTVTLQMLDAFAHLKRQHIIHCDLKPENILIKNPLVCFGAGPGKSSVAYGNVPVETVCVIDFGSSCLDSAPIYSYIQSRFYRSPEVILGHPYDTAIDMWSVGCVVAELFTGHPMFAGENETEQLMCMMEILGVPQPEYLARCKRRKYFFQDVHEPASVEGNGKSDTVVYKPISFTNSRGRKRVPGTRDLVTILRADDADFIAFVRKCFAWDPKDRLTPEKAMVEPWLLKNETQAVEQG